MRISIVTISYNQYQYLRECIDSVLNQNDVEIEYIIVDPGSTDGSRELINSYNNRIDKIVLDPDKGSADGLNNGFARASGDIFGYINSDDMLLPDALRHVKNVFEKHPDIDVVYGDGSRIDGDGKEIARMYGCQWDLRAYVFGGISIVQQSTFFRRKYFEAAGGFNLDNKTCWDGELLVDMALCGARFRYIHRNLGVFRIHEESISGSGRLQNQYRKDRARLKEKVVGGDLSIISEHMWVYFYRVRKWFLNPITIFPSLRRIIAKARIE